MDAEKALKWMRNIQRAQGVYIRYLDVKYKAISTKQKMEPIVESMKEGMRIGHGVGKVLNDEVTKNDVKWVFNQAQSSFFNSFARAIDAKAKARKKKTKAR